MHRRLKRTLLIIITIISVLTYLQRKLNCRLAGLVILRKTVRNILTCEANGLNANTCERIVQITCNMHN